MTASGDLTVVTGGATAPAGRTGSGRLKGVKPFVATGSAGGVLVLTLDLASDSRIPAITGLTQRNKSSTEMSRIMLNVINNHASSATIAPPVPRLLNRRRS